MRNQKEYPNGIDVKATERKLKDAESQLAAVSKQAYVVVYVDALLRSEREDCTFFEAVQNELRERELLNLAHEFMAFERFRRGMEPPRNELTP